MKKSLLLHVGIALGMAAFGQTEDSAFIRRLADEILTNSGAYENLRHLTKKIGPRLAGSTGMVKSEKWGLERMKEAGADLAWMQECKVPHWERGGEDVAHASFSGIKQRKLDVVALGNSLGTGGSPVVASVIEIRSFEELEQKKDLVKGKIVFYNYHFKPTFVRTFEAYRDAVKYRGSGPSMAAKYGARAVIARSMSHSTDNNPHTGSLRYDTNHAKIPAVAIGLQDADWLSAQLAKQPVTVTLKTNGKFLPDATGHNIIGELKGGEFPDEIITIGGHLDSWDNCEGAHDDGAGCVQTIEVLRAMQAVGYKPRRTIRFVLFANEENGLAGGLKYAAEAKAKGEKHIFALESDAGGFTPRGFGITASPSQFAKFASWQDILAPYGAREIVSGGGGADIGPLRESHGTVVSSYLPDSQRYFDIHHARSDVFESVNKRELDLGAVNMAALIYLVDKYGL